MTDLDGTVHDSLSSFVENELDGSWNGRREREAVSLYVMGHLLRRVEDSGFLNCPTQVGIEVPVPQLSEDVSTALTGRDGSKRQVTKDIVVWPRPRMTCWDQDGEPTVAPAAILEWKFAYPRIYEPDLEWLRQYSLVHSEFTGYAVTGNPPGAAFLLTCTRVAAGAVEPEWLHVK
jgi:hypothetical protein